MAPPLSHFWKQSFRLPEPTLTEANLPSQAGKVVIVTGSNTGVGLELAQILYGKDATVYIACRSSEKAESAIARIQKAHPSSKGKLHFLKLDLSDLKMIHPAAQEFLSKEERLDVLVSKSS